MNEAAASPAGPPASADPGLTAELREVLLGAGYTGEGVRAALGTAGEVLSRSADIPLHLRRLDGNEPLGTLIKLLVLDAPVKTPKPRARSHRSRSTSSSRSGWSRAAPATYSRSCASSLTTTC